MTVKRDTPVAHHVGFVARDAEKMARAYERLLDATFDLLDPLPVHNLYDEQATIRVAYGAFANLVVEIIEPMDGHLPHHDFLDKYGEGIQHIGFQVDDPAAWTGRLAEAGAHIEWIVDDTNHLSIGYLTPDSTNEEMVRRITPRLPLLPRCWHRQRRHRVHGAADPGPHAQSLGWSPRRDQDHHPHRPLPRWRALRASAHRRADHHHPAELVHRRTSRLIVSLRRRTGRTAR